MKVFAAGPNPIERDAQALSLLASQNNTSAMLVELQDAPMQVVHDQFQVWRHKNQTERFLTMETKTRANLHGAACQHLGTAFWTADTDGKHSLTRKRKILGSGAGSLAAWASVRGVDVALCKHCIRDALVDEGDLVVSPHSEQQIAAEGYSVVSAVEGQLREVKLMQRGRNPALRAAAISRADGVCEGCGVNFGTLFGNLGRGVLQVHHTNPLSERDDASETELDELAVLCANCHCLVHANSGLPMSIKELRALLLRAGDAFPLVEPDPLQPLPLPAV